jgi:thioredoxin-related protein
MAKVMINGLTGMFLALLSLNLQAAEEGALDEGMVNPGYVEHPAWFKQSFLDLRDDVNEAAQSGKRVLLYFYQDGCPYCKKLMTENFAMKDLVDKATRGFDTIAINMWGDREVTGMNGKTMTEKQFAAARQVMFTPSLVFLDEKGKDVLRINGYYPPHKFILALDYVSGKLENRQTFAEYVKEKNPVPATGKLHQESFYLKPGADLSARARGTGKPLMVLFEQKSCTPCDELHQDKLKRPELDAEVRQLDVALVDMWSKDTVTTPSGEKMTGEQWARKIGVKYAPSMVFFVNDKEVFRTDAYLRAFHTRMVMRYVSSGGYKTETSFQRWIAAEAEKLEKQGEHVDLWK